MDLYLMQHGEAVSEQRDPARPLTDAGRAAVERVATRALAAGVQVEACVHSGKTRAEQSALALADVLQVPAVNARADLDPSGPVSPFAQWLAEQQGSHESLAVVGHLPFLDRLASLLVAGEESAQVVRFQNAGLVRLVPKHDAGGFTVAWALVPDLA